MYGKIETLRLKKGGRWEEVNSLILEKNSGVKDDSHQAKRNIQITILSVEARRELDSSSIRGLCMDNFIENVTVSGINLASLKVGDLLKMGSAIVEVLQVGKKCYCECSIVQSGQKCLLSKEAIFARVAIDGKIITGDEVKIIE